MSEEPKETTKATAAAEAHGQAVADGVAAAVMGEPQKLSLEILADKFQILERDGLMVVVLPLAHVNRHAARGFLMEADDAVVGWYMQQQMKRKALIQPVGSSGIKGKLSKIFRH